MQVIVDNNYSIFEDCRNFKFKSNYSTLYGKENSWNEPPPPVTIPEVNEQLLKRSNKRKVKRVKLFGEQVKGIQ